MSNITLLKQQKVVTEDLAEAIKLLQENLPKTFMVLFLDDDEVLSVSAGAAKGISRYMQLGMLEAAKEVFNQDWTKL